MNLPQIGDEIYIPAGNSEKYNEIPEGIRTIKDVNIVKDAFNQDFVVKVLIKVDHYDRYIDYDLLLPYHNEYEDKHGNPIKNRKENKELRYKNNELKNENHYLSLNLESCKQQIVNLRKQIVNLRKQMKSYFVIAIIILIIKILWILLRL